MPLGVGGVGGAGGVSPTPNPDPQQTWTAPQTESPAFQNISSRLMSFFGINDTRPDLTKLLTAVKKFEASLLIEMDPLGFSVPDDNLGTDKWTPTKGEAQILGGIIEQLQSESTTTAVGGAAAGLASHGLGAIPTSILKGGMPSRKNAVNVIQNMHQGGLTALVKSAMARTIEAASKEVINGAFSESVEGNKALENTVRIGSGIGAGIISSLAMNPVQTALVRVQGTPGQTIVGVSSQMIKDMIQGYKKGVPIKQLLQEGPYAGFTQTAFRNVIWNIGYESGLALGLEKGTAFTASSLASSPSNLARQLTQFEGKQHSTIDVAKLLLKGNPRVWGSLVTGFGVMSLAGQIWEIAPTCVDAAIELLTKSKP